MAKNGWYSMSALGVVSGAVGEGDSPKKARVDIFGEIGWEVSGSQFLKELRGLGDVEEIDLRIHSGGGSVLDGWAVANGILNHPAKVTARVEGLAASMASVIALAADVVVMPENAYLMIHDVSAGAWGGSDELRSVADLVDKLGDDIVNFYAKRSELPVDEVREMMAAETWMNGAEALEKGFAHEVLEPVQAAAVAQGVSLENRFKNAPEELVNISQETPEETPEETPDETPQETPDETPDETPQETPEETPQETPEETPEETPQETPQETPEETPQETPEETPQETPEETPEEVENSDEGGIVSKFRSFLSARAGSGARGEDVAGSAAMVALRAENDRLSVALETATATAEGAVSDRDGLKARVETLEAESRELDAILSESGFTAADAHDLPAPDDGDGVESIEEIQKQILEARASGDAVRERTLRKQLQAEIAGV